MLCFIKLFYFQALSYSTGLEIIRSGDPQQQASTDTCLVMDKWFNIHNIRSPFESTKHNKPEVAPITSVDAQL